MALGSGCENEINFLYLEDQPTKIDLIILGDLGQQRSMGFILVNSEQENLSGALDTLIWQQFVSCVREMKIYRLVNQLRVLK